MAENLKLSWSDLLKDSRRYLAVLAVVVLAVYANSVNNEFISDDISAIVHNPKIASLTDTLKTGLSLSSLIPSVIFQVAGLNPPLYHLNNIVWHFGVSALIYLIIYLISNRKTLAVVTSVLFALHPIHTESVTWIAGFSYVGYAFFSLLTLFMCMLFDKGLVSRKYSVLLFLPAAGAFLSSFQAVVLPVLLMLYFFAFSSFKKGLKVIWPVWLTTLVFGVSFLTPLFSRVSDFSYDPQGSLIVLNPLIQIPLALVSYLKLILFPVGLTLYHESFYAPTWLLLIYLFGITLYGILSVLCFKKNRIVFFGLVLFPLALAPTLLPIFLNWLVAERYVYLGSLGIILVISYFLLYIKERSKLIFFVLFALVVSSYFILSVKRNFEWKNQDTLWPATVAVSPGSTLAHNNMGDYYARRGDLKSAAKEFGTAVALKPDNANAIHNLGFTYLQMGEATKAAELFDKALTIDPKLIEAAIGLYSVYAQNNDQTKAKAALERAIQINPNAPVVYNVLAVELLKNGQKEEAVRMLRKALEVDPNFLPAKQNLEIVR